MVDARQTRPAPTVEGTATSPFDVALTPQRWLAYIADAVDHAVDAGPVSWTFALPEPTVTHTPAAPDTSLLLTDFDDTGLTVDAAALLAASAPGTTGSTPYADSDRGGTDSPLDGELGLGTTNTVISRIQRFSTTKLVLNDNDNPAALSLNTYFAAGGSDLTLYLQTAADGLVSFAVSAQIDTSGGNFVRFTLPADAQTLLDNISTGDRFIFALARPAPVPVDHAVNAGNASWAFALPEPTVTHTPATPTTTDHAVDAGNANWAFNLPEPFVTHTPASGVGVSVTVDLGAPVGLSSRIVWTQVVDIGSTFDADGVGQSINQLSLTFSGGNAGLIGLSISGVGNRFTPAFEASGRIIFEASDGEILEVTIGGADTSEPYAWTPANAADVIAFAIHIDGLTDRTATLTLTGEGPATATDHAVDAGAASWTFALPEPTVTHTTAQPTDHAVNAGFVSWAFALPSADGYAYSGSNST